MQYEATVPNQGIITTTSQEDEIRLTNHMVAEFTRDYVLSNLDSPKAIPNFHMELWQKCCSDSRYVALVCPRGHGKSTAVTGIFALASIMERKRDYVVIISDTSAQAILFLTGIKALIEQSPEMQKDYGFAGWIKDGATEVVGKFKDGSQFCIKTMGSGQQIRGSLWRNKRPNLIICDDIEDEKSVESDDQREKTRKWMYGDVMPALSDNGVIRMVGTILHLDALLYNLHYKNEDWSTKLYKAHNSFNDFGGLLWEEKFSEERLRKEQKVYILSGHPGQYSTEYLNDPIDQLDGYFTEDAFIAMNSNDRALPMAYYAAVDLAISDRDRASYTAMVICGLANNGMLYVVDMLRYRSNDAREHIKNMLDLQEKYNVIQWKIEHGMIWQSIEGFLRQQMTQRQVFMDIAPDAVPMSEKRARAFSFQGLMNAGHVAWDTTAHWYADCKQELLEFPKSAYKDQVDALAWMGRMISEIYPALGEEDSLNQIREREQEQYNEELESTFFGMDPDTGY
ncbi:MAG: phage terminase large subunit [Nitrososphaerales archaeon]